MPAYFASKECFRVGDEWLAGEGGEDPDPGDGFPEGSNEPWRNPGSVSHPTFFEALEIEPRPYVASWLNSTWENGFGIPNPAPGTPDIYFPEAPVERGPILVTRGHEEIPMYISRYPDTYLDPAMVYGSAYRARINVPEGAELFAGGISLSRALDEEDSYFNYPVENLTVEVIPVSVPEGAVLVGVAEEEDAMVFANITDPPAGLYDFIVITRHDPAGVGAYSANCLIGGPVAGIEVVIEWFEFLLEGE